MCIGLPPIITAYNFNYSNTVCEKETKKKAPGCPQEKTTKRMTKRVLEFKNRIYEVF